MYSARYPKKGSLGKKPTSPNVYTRVSKYAPNVYTRVSKYAPNVYTRILRICLNKS